MIFAVFDVSVIACRR